MPPKAPPAQPITSPDATAVNALAQLPPSLAVIKMENDNFQQLAIARPRDVAAITQELIAQIKQFPAFAREVVYAKPVGRDPHVCHKCQRKFYPKEKESNTCPCGSTQTTPGVMKVARNLSVRAAEAIAEAYGYNRTRTSVEPIDDDNVRIEATFSDYQRGRIWQDAAIVSRWYIDKQGARRRYYEDRFFATVVPAAVSRRVREVILRSVSPVIRLQLFEASRAATTELLGRETVETIAGRFASIGVGLPHLERFLAKTVAGGWSQEDRQTLLDVWSAIQTGETTVAEAFGVFTVDGPIVETPAPSAAGGLSGLDLTGGATPKDPEEPAPWDTGKPAATDPDATTAAGEAEVPSVSPPGPVEPGSETAPTQPLAEPPPTTTPAAPAEAPPAEPAQPAAAEPAPTAPEAAAEAPASPPAEQEPAATAADPATAGPTLPDGSPATVKNYQIRMDRARLPAALSRFARLIAEDTRLTDDQKASLEEYRAQKQAILDAAATKK